MDGSSINGLNELTHQSLDVFMRNLCWYICLSYIWYIETFLRLFTEQMSQITEGYNLWGHWGLTVFSQHNLHQSLLASDLLSVVCSTSGSHHAQTNHINSINTAFSKDASLETYTPLHMVQPLPLPLIPQCIFDNNAWLRATVFFPYWNNKTLDADIIFMFCLI